MTAKNILYSKGNFVNSKKGKPMNTKNMQNLKEWQMAMVPIYFGTFITTYAGGIDKSKGQ